MDYAPLWIPILLSLVLFLVSGPIICIYKRRSFKEELVGFFRRFLHEAVQHPIRAVRDMAGATMLLWIMGVGFIQFGLMLWLIHFELKADFLEWMFS